MRALPILLVKLQKILELQELDVVVQEPSEGTNCPMTHTPKKMNIRLCLDAKRLGDLAAESKASPPQERRGQEK